MHKKLMLQNTEVKKIYGVLDNNVRGDNEKQPSTLHGLFCLCFIGENNVYICSFVCCGGGVAPSLPYHPHFGGFVSQLVS